MPLVREANLVRVETADFAPSVRVLTETAERRFPDRPFVEVLHEPIGAELVPEFDARGWRVTRHLVMALRRRPAAQAEPVEEVAPEVVWPLRDEWLRGEPWATDAVATAMLAWERARARVTGARAFCARDGAGVPVSMCLLLSTPHADEIESVYTTPAARGRGRAFAVVARAAREAGEHLTFLFTDADGAAQRLYGRLGFRAAGVVHRFSGEHAGR
jgi:GNAT superfamily N-acetyltransferase